MSTGKCVPLRLRDTSQWPCPEDIAVPMAKRMRFLQQKAAVEMYCANEPYSKIVAETGVGDRRVRHLIKNCLDTDPKTRGIRGFHACVPGARAKPYTRRTPFTGFSKKPDENGNYKKGNPCGMLLVFFDQFPEIEEELIRLYLKRGKGPFEKRITFMSLAATMREMARKRGLKDTQWPLCSTDGGYEVIRRWAHDLLNEFPEQYILARFGRQAYKNLRKGTGEPSLVENLRPLSAREIDFHKVDCACVIVFTDPHGAEICVPVERFHLGAMVSEYPAVVFGYAIVLEATPSADSVLEVVESCLYPKLPGSARMSLTPRGDVVIGAKIEQLWANGFSLLRMDSGSSNIANDTISNIMDVIGCAIQLGPIAQWWTRALVENFFGIFTRKTGQQLPSSYGSSPLDPMRDKPVEMAQRMHIRIDDLVETYGDFMEEYNTRQPSKKTAGQTPVDMIRALLKDKTSGVFSQPLPDANGDSWTHMAHTVEASICGSKCGGKLKALKRGTRPFIKIDNTIYTSPTLSRRFDLLGKRVIVFMHRKNANIACAITKDDHEYLGRLVPDKDARRFPLPVYLRKRVNSFVRRQRHALARPGNTRIYVEERVKAMRSTENHGGGREGLSLAHLYQKIEQMPADDSIPATDEVVVPAGQPAKSFIVRPPAPVQMPETPAIAVPIGLKRDVRNRGRGF
ncbi:hypothetical protein [Paraburkholderia sp. RL17-337-BIB-A]|uniref:hypothetical protein n=1 Tax=Paraburkholderia sp. RL17-337-BIB-A TaxID=3031636 RepID=UPI0038B809B6